MDGVKKRNDPAISLLLERLVVEVGVAPGAAAAVAVRGQSGWICAVGAAGFTSSAADAVTIEPETPFDLASVSKSFVAVTLARLARERHLDLGATVGELLPSLADSAVGQTPLDLLLGHRSGLVAHLELFAPLRDGGRFAREDALLTAAEAIREECRPPVPAGGYAPVYSDLGYIILGAAAEARTRSSLDRLVFEEVSEPLGIDVASARQWRQRGVDLTTRAAATEVVAWRGGELRGVVHDENCFALAGEGLAGHAGLFGSSAGVCLFGAALIDALSGRTPAWLSPDDVWRLVRPRPGGTLRAGFDSPSPEASSSGPQFGPDAFGHLGFTGTSLWCDPELGLCVAVLTNRVHPTRENILIRQARPRLHDELASFGIQLRSREQRA